MNNYQLPGYQEVMTKLDAFIPEPTGESLARKIERQNKLYKSQIDCPFARDGSHTATVYTQGHLWAGIIECDQCEIEDTCQHPETHSEEQEVTYFSTPDTDASYDTTIAVCNDCQQTVEGE